MTLMLPATGTLLHWVSEFGYPFLGGLLLVSAAGAPIPIEMVLVALGALSAAHGGPSFATLAAVGLGATVAGDVLDYAAGRLLGRRVIERWMRRIAPEGGRGSGSGDDETTAWHSWMQRMLEWSGSGPMILLTRCLLTPLEMPISLLAGASRRSFRSFLLWDLLGEALYVFGYLTLGHAGGTLAASGPLLLALGSLAALLSCVPLLLVRLVAGWQRPLRFPRLRPPLLSSLRGVPGPARVRRIAPPREPITA